MKIIQSFLVTVALVIVFAIAYWLTYITNGLFAIVCLGMAVFCFFWFVIWLFFFDDGDW